MTDTQIDPIATLQAQLDSARQAEQAQAVQLAADARDRELGYRRDRLASYDPATYHAAVREVDARLRAEVAASPLLSALVDRQAAVWRQYRAAQDAHSDAVVLAEAEGRVPPHDPGASAPPLNTPDHLGRVLEWAVRDRIDQDAEDVNQAMMSVVTGEQDPTKLAQAVLDAEQRAEVERRRQSAMTTLSTSVDVTGLDDDQRAALGLPPGSSRKR